MEWFELLWCFPSFYCTTLGGRSLLLHVCPKASARRCYQLNRIDLSTSAHHATRSNSNMRLSTKEHNILRWEVRRQILGNKDRRINESTWASAFWQPLRTRQTHDVLVCCFNGRFICFRRLPNRSFGGGGWKYTRATIKRKEACVVCLRKISFTRARRHFTTFY